jgi:LacI family transcriptional regulator
MANWNILLLINTSRQLSRDLAVGIGKYSQLHGPWTFEWDLSLYEKNPKEQKYPIREREVDGIIISDVPSQRIYDAVSALGIPTIVRSVNQPVPHLPNILSNNNMIAVMAAEHLMSQGLKHYAYVGFDDLLWSQQRKEGFIRRLQTAGFEPYVYQQPKLHVQRLWREEKHYMANWLATCPRPLGIMSCNDDRGVQVTGACKLAGLCVPGDAAIIGVDNDEIVCKLNNPPLSSIARSFEIAGYQAAELLEKLITGQQVDDKTIVVNPTHVVTRQSTNILAIEDDDVKEALSFIRQNVKNMIQVDDVLRAVAMSRRGLGEKFKKIVGRTIHKEIVRMRVDHIANLLLETRFSISKISEQLGFSNCDHMSCYFKRQMGITPLEYRKQNRIWTD